MSILLNLTILSSYSIPLIIFLVSLSFCIISLPIYVLIYSVSDHEQTSSSLLYPERGRLLPSFLPFRLINTTISPHFTLLSIQPHIFPLLPHKEKEEVNPRPLQHRLCGIRLSSMLMVFEIGCAAGGLHISAEFFSSSSSFPLRWGALGRCVLLPTNNTSYYWPRGAWHSV